MMALQSQLLKSSGAFSPVYREGSFDVKPVGDVHIEVGEVEKDIWEVRTR
jgi:hypothetical protein